MSRRPPTKHSFEVIKTALRKVVRENKSITSVAKELNVAKSLMKYWLEHFMHLLEEKAPATGNPKANERTRAFMEKAWTSMNIAFEKLDKELKAESPRGVRDLVLAVSILFDKLTQASQQLNALAPAQSKVLEVSEDTLMILKRHMERRTIEPKTVEAEPVETHLDAAHPEQQKKEPDVASDDSGTVAP